ARRVAFPAMGERGDQIGAAIVGLTMVRRRMEWARSEKQELPAILQEAPGKRKGEVVRPAGLPHRRLGEQIGLDRPRIVVGDPGKARIREYREIVGAVGSHALAQRSEEFRITPPADAGV